jgi:uncharacterized protein
MRLRSRKYAFVLNTVWILKFRIVSVRLRRHINAVMSELFYHLPLVLGTFFIAGGVKGVIGLGLPTVAMGVLGTVMAPAEAAALLLIPSALTNVWQMFSGARLAPLVHRLWPMMAAVCVGTILGSGLISGNGGRYATGALGAALAAYAALGLSGKRFHVPGRHEKWLGPAIGLTTGVVCGATGVFVIPAVPYLAALGLERDDLVQALGLSFTVSTIALAAGLGWHHSLPMQALGMSLLALVPALLGMAAGGAIRAVVSPETFRFFLYVGLLGLGGEILWRALSP